MPEITRKINLFLIFTFASLAIVFFADSALAGSAVLSWDANTEPDLAGYKIYYDTASHVGNCPGGFANANYRDAGNVTTYTINNLAEGYVYYFQLTAYDTDNNESSCSGEVSKIMYYKGDFTKNRTVDIFDFNALVTNFGKTNVCGNIADSNGDCKVDIFDYSNLVADFGKSF